MDSTTIPILVISLDRRPDRWAKFQERAAAAHIDPSRIIRISAVDAKTLDVERHPAVGILAAHNIHYKTRRAHYEIDVPGAIGASLSHFKTWTWIQDSTRDTNAIIVLEDDTSIPPNFNEGLAKLVADLPPSWDIVSFYNTQFEGGETGCKAIKGKAPWSACESLMGAHAYMVSRAGARKLLEKAYPIDIHVDAYIAFMHRLKYIQMLWHPAIQMPAAADDTDIGHGDTGILNVPTNMNMEGVVALNTMSIVGIVAMVAITGGLISLAYGSTRR